MAEAVAIMAMRPLVSMLISKASSYLLDKYKVMEGMEKQLKILKRRLSAILDVIIDAEKQATEHREGAKVWLQDLKTVAYEANEVFDEFKYEALRREAMKNGHYRKRDAIKLFPTHNRVVFRHRMGIKLCRILEDIEALLTDMQVFGFKYQQQPPLSKEGRQTNHVIFDPKEIASRSRDKEKRNVVDTLLRQANNADLAVVPIVGMGGLGKTILAQLIYNEPEIRKHFQLPLWVCVSDTFDVNSLAKNIVEASTKKNGDTDEPPQPPLDRLQKLVKGQRFLLVLDDVWNREVHKWEQLKVCLQHGDSGSAVLTTTRDKRVAEIMGTVGAYHLNFLEANFLKEIIEAKAFGSEGERPTKLVEMVGEIVKRCCGSPLAATALGSVLRTKTSAEEWEAVLTGSSICTKETGILPILKLSYNELPSHMKQCFAFCAVFPKDYKIHVDKLIQLWIANGFIPEHKEDSFETAGKQIFDELASRSFFVEIEKSKERWNGNYSITTCKIHDLMHDIATSVMEKECLVATVKPSQTEWLPDTARHLYLSCEGTEGILNDCMEKTSPAIQTLMCDVEIKSHLKYLTKYSSLHALKLCARTESFVLKPKYLPQLRYLDLSSSYIKELPEDISILYNLQMLDLSSCYYLNRLPRQMKYMTSLCHIYTHGCRTLKSMPPELGRLTKLQTLTCFVAADVAGPDCSDVAELQKLNLGGQLEICQVENVREAEKKLANLGNKKDLIELTLRWTSVGDTEVLSSFEPHDRLQVLKIHSYGGKCLGILQSMVEIHLSRCERLQVLFKCGTFPNLKELMLEHLLDFERWSERNEEQITFPRLAELSIENCPKLITLPGAPLLQETCTEGGYRLARSAFPALKVLKLKKLESFQRWDATVEGVEILFPRLEELSIERCRKLIALPEAPLLQETCTGGGYRLVRSAFPALKVLKLEMLESFQRWDAAVEGVELLFPRLEKLSIERCRKLIALPEAPSLQETCTEGGYRLARSAFPALKVLKLEYLVSFERWDAAVEGVEILFPRLEELSIRRCRKLISLPKAPCNGNYCSTFPALKVLQMKNLESFHKWDANAGSEQMLFPQLENLSIVACPELMDLPEAPKLSVLEIVDGKQEIFYWVDTYWSSLTELTLKLENTETTSGAECTSMLPVDIKEKWNQISPHTFVQLGCCNSFFGSGGLEPWGYFVHLGGLAIDRCDVLVHWPDVVFQSLVSLKRLEIQNCNNLTGYAETLLEPSASERCQRLPALEFLRLTECASLVEMFNVPASLRRMSIWECNKLEYIFGKQQLGSEPIVPTAVSQLSSSPVNHFCPCLEYLRLNNCDSLSGVVHLPPSLKTIDIASCSSIQVLSCQLDGLPKPQDLSAAGEHSLPPCLEDLSIWSCTGMLGGILHLPTSLKQLIIKDNSGLTSLEPVSGPSPLSLERLWLIHCSALAFLPDEPQAYGSLSDLEIADCPAIKKLPRCLQQRQGSIKKKDLDAKLLAMAFKPKTWKEIPRLVRERKMARKEAKRMTKWMAERRQANRTIEEQDAE